MEELRTSFNLAALKLKNAQWDLDALHIQLFLLNQNLVGYSSFPSPSASASAGKRALAMG